MSLSERDFVSILRTRTVQPRICFYYCIAYQHMLMESSVVMPQIDIRMEVEHFERCNLDLCDVAANKYLNAGTM